MEMFLSKSWCFARRLYFFDKKIYVNRNIFEHVTVFCTKANLNVLNCLWQKSFGSLYFPLRVSKKPYNNMVSAMNELEFTERKANIKNKKDCRGQGPRWICQGNIRPPLIY